jgi:hypothetical protein
MVDPVIGAFAFTGALAAFGVVAFFVAGPNPVGSFSLVAARYFVGWPSVVWFPIALAVIIVRWLSI